jgi:drug/metabolite transporter (DMT)-like permease
MCLIAAVLFGASTPGVSRLGRGMNPFTLAGLLYLGAAVVVMPWAMRHIPTSATLRTVGLRLCVAVVSGGAIGPLLLALGLRHTPASTASLLLNLELVFTTVLAVLIFHEHLGRRLLLGTGLVVTAGLLLAWSSDTGLRWGALLIAGACACWAVDNSVTAKLDELAPAQITLAKGIVAGGANLAIGLVASGAPSLSKALTVGLVGAVGYGVSITLWIVGARELGAARGQLVFASAPFMGVFVAWAVLREPVHGREVISLALALLGVSMVMGSDHSHSHAHRMVEHDHAHEHDEHHSHGHEISVSGRHTHLHLHEPVSHAHAHLPDVHHRHAHD